MIYYEDLLNDDLDFLKLSFKHKLQVKIDK